MFKNQVTIGQFLQQIKREVLLKPEVSYNLLGVKWYGKGVFVRESKLGREIKAKKLYKVKTGDFIYNRLFAWKSSFAIISKEFDGCLVSGEFPTFVKKSKDVNIDFLIQYILLPHNINKVDKLSTGMSSVSRKRFKEKSFLSFPIPDLDLDEQKNIAAKISKHHIFSHNFENELERQHSLLKKLRQAILQEAVEGKLTAEWRQQRMIQLAKKSGKTLCELRELRENDPDYSAKALLEKIKAEKAALTKDTKRTKRIKELPPITDAEKPFDLPEGWVWCRLGEISNLITKGSSPNWQGVSYVREGEGIRFITSKNVDHYYINLDKETFVESIFNEVESRSILKQGDILTNIVGASIGRTALYTLTEISNINQAVCLIRIESELINKSYLLHWMNSTIFINKMHDYEFAPGRANLSLTNVSEFLFPFPPEKEQQAIVEKVDRLLAKIDKLEEQVKDRKAQAEQLMQAVLREAFTQSA